MLSSDTTKPADVDGVFKYDVNIEAPWEPTTEHVRYIIVRTLRLFPESTNDRSTITDGQGVGPFAEADDE